MEFNDLLSFHRNQESTELTLLGLIFTVSLALLSLFGSNNRIAPAARFLIAFVYASFMTTVLWSLNDSFKVHNALHLHLRSAATNDPDLFSVGGNAVKGAGSLTEVFANQFNALPTPWLLFGGTLLGLIVLLVILALGDGKVISLPFISRTSTWHEET